MIAPLVGPNTDPGERTLAHDAIRHDQPEARNHPLEPELAGAQRRLTIMRPDLGVLEGAIFA
jgi:hypothetical protein